MTATPPLDEIEDDVAIPLDADTEETPYGKNFRDLPTQLKTAILDMVAKFQREEMYYRRMECLQDAEHRFYDNGFQHIYCRNNSYYSAMPGTTYSVDDDQITFGNYIDDYNIFTPFALIQRAKLTENNPGIDFQPINPNEQADMTAAKTAEAMRHDFDRNNDVKGHENALIYHLQMGGRFTQWTRTEDADERFGTGNNGAPRHGSISTVYGCLESKIPLFANDQRDFPYAMVIDDPDIRIAKAKYEWIKEKLQKGQSAYKEEPYERILRLGIVQGGKNLQIGESISHLIGRLNCWIRIQCFIECEDQFVDENDPGAEPTTVYEALKSLFPNGVHVCVVGQEYAEAWNESMDDCIETGCAYTGKGQSRMPIMKVMVVVQDRFNSFMNCSAENFDFGQPSIWVTCDPHDYKAIQKQKSEPWAFRHMKQLPAGLKMQDCIYREPPPELPKSFVEYGQFISSTLPQFQLAVPPSIWGQAMADQKTASGYQLASQQAMGILGVFWQVLSKAMAALYYHNCLAIQKDDNFPEDLTIEKDGISITVHKAALEKGHFRAFADTESGFPESTAAKRQTITNVFTQLGQTPEGLAVLNDPDNVALYLRENGVPEIRVPAAQAREKQMREISELLKESPILAPEIAAMLGGAGPDGQPTGSVASLPSIVKAIDQAIQMGSALQQNAYTDHAADTLAASAQGQQPPQMPVPFDPSSVARSSVSVLQSDFHPDEARKCQDWLSSSERFREETIGSDGKPNLAGVLNVFLHWREHVAAGAPAMPPAGPLKPVGAPPQAPGAAAPPAAAPGIAVPAGV